MKHYKHETFRKHEKAFGNIWLQKCEIQDNIQKVNMKKYPSN